jgi:DNA repair protein RecN (Recombination protein N)
LSREVEFALRELAMPHACFAVELPAAARTDDLPSGPAGAEAPGFTFCANRGESLRALRHVVSGGELSRAFLAIKQVLRQDDEGMVLVFDEVDAGVGGAAADRVGRRLAELAAHHQVLCITHLPQIAAFADAHFRVEKLERRGRTVARIERVEGSDRIEEIARMAGGERTGKATRQFARELLAARAPR